MDRQRWKNNKLEMMSMGNVNVHVTNSEEALDHIEHSIRENQSSQIFFINAHCYNIAQKDEVYRRHLNEGDLILNDGIGLSLGATYFGFKFKENLNGTDFMPKLLKRIAQMKGTVFLLGGEKGVAEAAASQLKQAIPDIQIVGCLHGYFHDPQVVIRTINEKNPDMVIVAMGTPYQEKFIAEFASQLHTKVCIGVGAYLDFASKKVKRAPTWVRKRKLEWVYRLWLEPKRLWRRYLIGNFLFLYYIMKNKWKYRHRNPLNKESLDSNE
ncbi:WecB/TagA/CpsF family glycosyltransferase [Longirhabdus pacifica]|uniref:WecB/TagA/CpsF family glycosyltransferase n=1 Tax=Longirhabdus pacifica TaxID=2305227 RepID=UPI0013E89DDB|nr:WecB/TagA/CpsF family glycosyltransferase [Longirhabdus pacifica]